ncbi:MAG TPA: glycosyltransferase family 39 protein [Anaerolineae bacterium]|nr:glycosyltransferase family 39 protein [Anaerolineae bacterium]
MKPSRAAISRWLLPVALIILAAMLRLPTLDKQSFWVDESYAVWFIDRPFNEALRLIITPENNGPLYFLLLWGWHRLAGPSDFAVRYLSALCGVLNIAVLWQLGRTWFNRRVGSWAALLMALSPFAIWYAQEAKMYALHMLLATLALLLLTRALRRMRWQHWLAYVLCVNLLAYSHFFGAFTIAAQGMLVLITTWRDWRRLGAYAGAMALSALPYLPVLRFVWTLLPTFQMQDPSKRFVPLPQMLRELLLEFSVRAWSWEHEGLWLFGLSALLVGGMLAAWRRGWRAGAWITGLLIFPLMLFYPVSFKIPVFTPKYLSAIFPIFLLILALAVETLRRRQSLLALGAVAVLLLGQTQAELRDLNDPAFQRTDWRFVAQYLEDHGAPDDIIVIYTDYMDRVLSRYYRGPIKIFSYPYDPKAPEPLYEQLQGEGFDRLWLVLHHDLVYAPDHRLIEAASERFPKITGQYPTLGQIRLLGFDMNWRHTQLPAAAAPVDFTFENGLRLVGYQVDATRLPATEEVSHPPSNWIHLTTYWARTAEAAPDPPRLDGLLTDASGGVWGRELVYAPAVFDFDPPAQWPADAIIEAHLDVNLNPVTPPGMYRLAVALENTAGERIPLLSGEAEASLTPIEIIK